MDNREDTRLRPKAMYRRALENFVSSGLLMKTPSPLQPTARLLNDYGNLARYAAANSRLSAPGETEERVVFIGDSITENWGLDFLAGSAPFFPGKAYVNRGIGGQVTAQILLRFQADVVELQPRVVVLLAGINDISGHFGPVSDSVIRRNIATMVDLARANRIAVVLASLLPVSGDFGLLPRYLAPERIVALNEWLRGYAICHELVYLNYFATSADSCGRLRADLTFDGLHPNAAGYALMAAAAEDAISRALVRSI